MNEQTPLPPRLLTTDDVAKLLSISRSSVHRMVIRDELTPIHVGHSVRFRLDELEQIMRGDVPVR